ncbi:hypothetical protein [Pelagibacterium sp. H642]|uniref:hypothetical protein n=1 Tax=Pelagibacterium sp. H642 TaxID=1881069 RepID=UPI0028158E3F|nr:hypothetical protein [Pelagibacterium sp. H642]WMT90976.1 hypothetical protein NO934_01605 [Pelagibacterium sp. H642]
MAETIDSVFRDFNTPGNPGSGDYEPEKPRIRALLRQLQGQSGAAVTRNTLASLQAITPPSENYMGIVLDDPDAENNGYYYRQANAWVKGRGFPDTFARVELSGSATAQTGLVGSGVNPADIDVFYAFVDVDNTGPLTLTIHGEPPREVVNLAGNPLAAGEWTGTVMFALRDGRYQLLLDAGSAASAAQSASKAGNSASIATTEADRAVNAAQSVVARAWFKTAPSLFADNNQIIGYAGSGADFEVVAGDVVRTEEEGFVFLVAASDAGPFDKDSNPNGYHRENVGGVKFYVVPSKGAITARQFGTVGDGVADDAPLLQLAGDVAVHLGVRLTTDEDDIHFLGGQVDFFRVPGCDLQAAFLYGDGDMLPVKMRADSRNRHDYTLRIRSIVWSGATGEGSERTLPNQPMLQLVGLKNTYVHIGNVDYVQLYADSNDPATTSLAYCNFYFGQNERLEFATNPTPDGTPIQWINENRFFGGRFRRVIIGGTYTHNHNIWYSPVLERDTLLDFKVGQSNRLLEARLENTGIVLNFDAGTSNNLITQSWTSTPRDGIEPHGLNVTVTDAGIGNQVIRDRMAFVDRVIMFSLPYGPSNLASATSQFGVVGANLTKSGRGWTAAVGTLFTSQWIKCKAGAGFDINSDGPVWGYRIQFYDAAGNLVTSAADPGLLSAAGQNWDAANSRYIRSGFSSLPSAVMITTNEGWCTIELLSQSATPFQSLEVVGLVPFGADYTTLGSMQPKF